MAVFGEANDGAVFKADMAPGKGNAPVADRIVVNFDVVESPREGMKPAECAGGGFLEKSFLSLEVVRAKEKSFGPVE